MWNTEVEVNLIPSTYLHQQIINLTQRNSIILILETLWRWPDQEWWSARQAVGDISPAKPERKRPIGCSIHTWLAVRATLYHRLFARATVHTFRSSQLKIQKLITQNDAGHTCSFVVFGSWLYCRQLLVPDTCKRQLHICWYKPDTLVRNMQFETICRLCYIWTNT
jgi:hypothetical protein